MLPSARVPIETQDRPPGRIEPASLRSTADEVAIQTVAPRLYLLEVSDHLSRAHIERALDQVWSRSDWAQPWGLIVHAHDGVTYDADIRATPVPEADHRAVGTAVVTSSSVQRMVISTIALALRVSSRFHLSAHEHREDAIAHMRRLIERAEAD